MYKKLLVAIFVAILIVFPIATLITLPDEDNPFSENENRYLSSFPNISLKSLADRRFMTGFESWVSDMFIGREGWIKLKNESELILGKKELDGVFVNPQMLIQKWKDYDKEAVDKNLVAINDFSERINIPVYFMLVPTAQEIYPEYIPLNADTGSQRAFIKHCFDALPSVNCIDVTSALAEHSDMYIYYRTDHHWTSLGAYFGYYSSATKMNFTPFDISNFNIEHASNSFLGTLFSKTLYDKTEPDIVDFYHLSTGNPEIIVEAFDGKETTERTSLYFRDFLGKKDKYSAYLGSNLPLLKIKNVSGGNGKKLLIFKDSYANCLVPFYSKNFSEITVIDLRFINTDYRTIINVSEFDQVLFVYNVISFSEDTNLIKLNLGKT